MTNPSDFFGVAVDWCLLGQVLTFLLGLLGGHRLALGRDVRKDYNLVARTVGDFLIAEQAGPHINRVCPTRGDLRALVAFMPWWRRARWLQAWASYQQACQEAHTDPDALGQVGYGDTTRIVAAVDRCLALVRLR